MLSRFEKDWKLLVHRSYPTIPQSRILNLGWQFTASFLIVQVTTNNQRDTWQAGGRIWATANIRGSVTRFYTRELDLFATELIVIPNFFATKYSLYYRAPKFFTNVQLKIWEYIGQTSLEDNYLSNRIDLLLAKNESIERLIETLIEQLSNCQNQPEIINEEEKGIIYRLAGII